VWRRDGAIEDLEVDKARVFLEAHGIDPPPPRPEAVTALLVSRKVRELVLYCYCGARARLESNAVRYGRPYGNGLCWICSRWPVCSGYVGAHPDGRPLGTLADATTMRLRQRLHAQVDPLWQVGTRRQRRAARRSVYRWLGQILDLTGPDCHIAQLDRDACVRALEMIRAHPYVPPIGS
jgi:hypothetical protein